jgi:hypothetical protein
MGMSAVMGKGAQFLTNCKNWPLKTLILNKSITFTSHDDQH